MQNRTQQIAFDIANELLNRNAIVAGLLPSHLRGAIEFVLRKHRVGVPCVHLRKVTYPDSSICGHEFKKTDQPAKLTEDKAEVTCRRCNKSIELGTAAKRAAWAAAAEVLRKDREAREGAP